MKFIIISAIWCNGCLKMKKVWKELETKYPKIEFEYLDYDMDEKVKEYEVGTVLPVAILYKDGQEIHRWVGEHKMEVFKQEIEYV